MRLLEKRPIPFGGLWSLWLLSAVTQCGDSRHAFARPAPRQSSTSEHDLASAGHSTRGVIGHSLPGNWRPFSDDSPWNTPIAADARVHPDSDVIMALIAAEAKHIRFARLYAIPVWVVDYGKVPLARVRSDRIFDTWDRDRKGWSDVGVPVAPEMWAEPTEDGHLCIIDPLKMLSWELSRFRRLEDGTPACTTFNIWDLRQAGVGNPNEGVRWTARGGRGSGFPEIGGLIRPEELQAGTIRHALVFSFPKNRKADNGAQMFIPPACRSDGKYPGRQYPIEGMRLQLDPSLTEKDFRRLGLNREGTIVARALQEYGMLDGDNGGAMAVQLQLLAPSAQDNYREWERLYPGFFETVEKIPSARFRVVYTGQPMVKR